MEDSTTITIDPAERQQTSSGTDDLSKNREKLSDQANRNNHAQPVDLVPEKKPLWRRVLITVALLSSVFLVALDVNILATATPKITTEFHSLEDAAWYTTSYNLAKLATQPAFGRLYTSFSLKWTFCWSIMVFIIGSIICAVAPNSAVLIFGRAFQGCSTAGVFTGGLVIAAYVVSKQKVPLFISFISTMFMVASIVGPVLGGILTESSLTWRFCFWINLPISAVCLVFTYFGFQEPARDHTNVTLKEKLLSLDPIGTCLILASMTCLVLALQWGGAVLPWSDSRVCGTLIGFGLLLVLFLFLQVRQKERALVPIRILIHRTVGFGCLAGGAVIMAINCLTVYLPFYFQATKGVSPATSGLYILALGIPNSLATVACGLLMTTTRYYIPYLMAGSAVLAVGSGLLSTLNVSSNVGHIIGYQFIASIGFGFSVQVPLTAMQNVLNEADLPTGNSLFMFAQSLGTVIALPIAQSVFLETLNKKLDARLSDAQASQIIDLGASSVDAGHMDDDLVPFVAAAYGYAVQAAVYVAVAAAVLGFVTAGLMEWKTLDFKKGADGAGGGSESAEDGHGTSGRFEESTRIFTGLRKYEEITGEVPLSKCTENSLGPASILLLLGAGLKNSEVSGM